MFICLKWYHFRLQTSSDDNETEQYQSKIATSRSTINKVFHQPCSSRRENVDTEAKTLTQLALCRKTKTYDRATASYSDCSKQKCCIRLQGSPITLQLLPESTSVQNSACGYLSVGLKSDTSKGQRNTGDTGKQGWDINVILRPEPELAKTRVNMYHTSKENTIHLGLKLQRFLPSVSPRCQTASPQLDNYPVLLHPSAERRLIEDARSEMARIFQEKLCNVYELSKDHDGIPLYSNGILTARDQLEYRSYDHTRGNVNTVPPTNDNTETLPHQLNSPPGNYIRSAPSSPRHPNTISQYNNYSDIRQHSRRTKTMESRTEASEENRINHSTSMVNLTKSHQSFSRDRKARLLQRRTKRSVSATFGSRQKRPKVAENTTEINPATWPSVQDIHRLKCDPNTEVLSYSNQWDNVQNMKSKAKLTAGGYYSVNDQHQPDDCINGNSDGTTDTLHKEIVKTRKPDIIVPCHTSGECDLCTSHWASQGLNCVHEETKIKSDSDVNRSKPPQPKIEKVTDEAPSNPARSTAKHQSQVQADALSSQKPKTQTVDEMETVYVKTQTAGSHDVMQGKTLTNAYKGYSDEPYVFQKETAPLKYLHGRPKVQVPDLTTKLLFRLSYMKVSE